MFDVLRSRSHCDGDSQDWKPWSRGVPQIGWKARASRRLASSSRRPAYGWG